jgi:hypothetical protein
VQDAILADAKRSPVIDLIDIRYWHYQADGSLYAPKGGQSLAPRQQARLLKPKKASFAQVYRAVKEYRLLYPEKAVIYSGDSYDQFGWAAFIAGGSLPVLPANTNKDLLKAAENMKPNSEIGPYVLAGEKGLIAYAGEGKITLNLSKWNGNFQVKYIDIKDGNVVKTIKNIKAGKTIDLTLPGGAGIIWLTKAE